MYTPKDHVITASELKAYLYSLEKEQEREKSKKVHEVHIAFDSMNPYNRT